MYDLILTLNLRGQMRQRRTTKTANDMLENRIDGYESQRGLGDNKKKKGRNRTNII